MNIKHLVLSGGGVSGIAGIGAIHQLFESNILKIENIKSIYGTSVGSIIGLFICFHKLGVSNEVIKDYIIKRPFHETYKINMNQILNIYDSKGIYNKDSAFILFKPFFQTIELSTEITMKELYKLTSIELFFYTVEINQFVLKELSHITTPDLPVIDAIYMSSTLPLIMSPLIKNNECFIDGGILCNYPILECLKNESLMNQSLKNDLEKEILGINYNYNTFKKITLVNENTNVVDYIITILNNIIIIVSNYISVKNEIPKTYYEISIPIQWSFKSIINMFYSEEERLYFYELGCQSGNLL
jgi:predicted patatin/cPLA2 family phospholipase